MTLELRLHQVVAFCLSGLIVGCALAFALFYAGASIGQAMKERAKADVVIAMANVEAARLKRDEAKFNSMIVMDKIAEQNNQAIQYFKCKRKKSKKVC